MEMGVWEEAEIFNNFFLKKCFDKNRDKKEKQTISTLHLIITNLEKVACSVWRFE